MIISELRDCAKVVPGTNSSKIEVDRSFAKLTCGIYDNMNKYKADDQSLLLKHGFLISTSKN